MSMTPAFRITQKYLKLVEALHESPEEVGTLRVFEHVSSGTTTIGRGNHTLTTVPKKCARTSKLPPWVDSRTLNGGILVF